MLGKIKYEEYNVCVVTEEFVKCMFERLGFIQLKDDDLLKKPKIYIPDLLFEFKGKKYCIEVRKDFQPTPNLLTRIPEQFYELIEKENVYGIIVILDKVPSEYKTLVRRNYNVDIYDISNVLYLIYGYDDLQKKLNRIINFSLEGIIPKETNIEMNNQKVKIKTKNDNYVEQLNKIKEGQQDSKQYEELIEKIIKDIFSNELMLFEKQYRTEDGINIFDMICKIKNEIEDDFFSTIEKFYKTKYILFEFKNYTDVIRQGQICTTEKYLFETALRKVAIIITRHGIDENGMRLAKGILRESGKLIIILDDEDIKEMIALYERGDKATRVLTKKLDEILTKLEK